MEDRQESEKLRLVSLVLHVSWQITKFCSKAEGLEEQLILGSSLEHLEYEQPSYKPIEQSVSRSISHTRGQRRKALPLCRLKDRTGRHLFSWKQRWPGFCDMIRKQGR